MSTHKYIDRICVVAVIAALLITAIFMNGEKLGIQLADKTMGYETRLFDTDNVHTIDIVMDDWDAFIETCENEEYAACSVVIDGEAYKNVGIRAKGNTSLSTVSSMNSDRYSFKVEFDQYDSTKSYYGLDKLSLNNIIQDTTYMKDYLTYQMMASFGVDAPLCSYVYITVNGEDWGLYLAVEGIEDSFLQRNYGSDYGELYKPDSMSFGGGRGNGMGFDIEDFMSSDSEVNASDNTQINGESAGDESTAEKKSNNAAAWGEGNRQMPGGGMGSSDVKLQYIDDDPESYTNIFNNAKTEISEGDQTRLIESLKALSENVDIEDVVNVEEVIRYFVVHNFVCNNDSYTGTMVHNYYLYEEDGQLSMIPWDYNLAFGTFQGSNATSTVNSPIDTPVSGSTDDRPMVDWIFNDETYTELYHQYFAEFLETVDFESIIDETSALIGTYVEKDPTKFYSYEEFEAGISVLKEFCSLRAQSVNGQINGTIPSTTEGQNEDGTSLIDASHIMLSDMGTMGGGMGAGFPTGGFGSFGNMMDDETDHNQMQESETEMDSESEIETEETQDVSESTGDMESGLPQMPEGMTPPEGMEIPEGVQMPGDTQMIDGSQVAESNQTEQETETAEENSEKLESIGTFDENVPDSDGVTMPENTEFSEDIQVGKNATMSGNAPMSRESAIVLVFSTVVLVFGLAFLFGYKRRK